MISLLLLECAVMLPDGNTYDRFKAEDGWSIARLGPLQWRVSRAANEPENIRAVPEVTLDGYAGVYVEAEPPAIDPFLSRDGTQRYEGLEAFAAQRQTSNDQAVLAAQQDRRQRKPKVPKP